MTTAPTANEADDELYESTLGLDGPTALAEKAARRRRLNTFEIPALRFAGLALVTSFVVIYGGAGHVAFATAVAAYVLLSWAALRVWYARVSSFDLGVAFLTADVFVFTAAIALTGGVESWLVFLLAVRAADQANTSFRRVIYFAIVSVGCYAGLILSAVLVDGRPVDPGLEAAKVAILAFTNVYIALAARSASNLRRRMATTLRLSSSLVRKIRESEGALEARVRQQAHVAALSRATLLDTELDLLFADAMQRLGDGLDTEFVALIERTPDGAGQTVRAATGWGSRYVGKRVGATLSALARYTIDAGEPVLVDDLVAESRFSVPREIDYYRIASAISVVVDGRNAPWGVLAAATSAERRFGHDDIGFLESVAGVLASAVERRLADEAVHSSEDRYRDLFENATDLIQSVAPDGTFLVVNRAWRDALGYETDELARLKVYDVVHPRERERYRDLRARLLAGAPPESFVTTFVSKSGEDVQIEGTLSVRVVGGQAVALRGILRDVTERRRAEEALRQSQTEYRSLVENSPVGIYRTTPEGRFLMANEALVRMLGFDSFEELAAIDLTSAASPLTDYPRTLFKQRIEQDGSVKDLESWWLRKDGTRIAIRENAVTIRDPHGRVLYYEGTADDVTERRRYQDEILAARLAAESADRSKSEFLANVSHEIRTPMNAIIGLAGVLLDTRLDTRQRDFAETIRQSGDALLTIINDILDFSKMEAGRLELDERPFSLRDCVEDALDLLALKAARKGLELFYRATEKVPDTLHGDGTRLRQVLVNLVSNSVKFTETGEVSVDVRVGSTIGDRCELIFAVRDTGIGIAPESAESLFQPFSQVDSTTSRQFGGTGLGLAISRQLVEMMGGAIRFESAPGAGTTFEFSIVAGVRADDATASTPIYGLTGLRLLVVDGNPASRAMLAELARGWGLETATVASPDEALVRTRSGPAFDLAIVSEAPGRPELLAARFAEITDLPFVVLHAPGNVTRLAIESRAVVAAITKPVKPASLGRALLAVLGHEELESGSHLPAVAGVDAPGGQAALRVLVVEDNAVNQKVALLLLDQLGYRADVAQNGHEALAALDRQAYDVVLMDIQMPGMDGLEATRRIRARWPRSLGPRIVAMTANAMRGDRDRCIAAGMDDYVPKPIKIGDLLTALQRSGSTLDTPPGGFEPVVAAETGIHSLDPSRLATLRRLETVSAAKIVERILSEFLIDATRRIGAIDHAAVRRDAEAVRREAHQLKGASANVGATRVAAICSSVEDLARASQYDELPRAVGLLLAEFDRVRVAVEAELRAPASATDAG